MMMMMAMIGSLLTIRRYRLFHTWWWWWWWWKWRRRRFDDSIIRGWRLFCAWWRQWWWWYWRLYVFNISSIYDDDDDVDLSCAGCQQWWFGDSWIYMPSLFRTSRRRSLNCMSAMLMMMITQMSCNVYSEHDFFFWVMTLMISHVWCLDALMLSPHRRHRRFSLSRSLIFMKIAVRSSNRQTRRHRDVFGREVNHVKRLVP